MYYWARRDKNGYEVSSKGDKRFSALYARMPDGRTIEEHYQCDVKGYDVGGTNWKLGKGKPPINKVTDPWSYYLLLWVVWTMHNVDQIDDLKEKMGNRRVLTDCFASSDVNQARALAVILNTMGGNNE